MNVGAVFMVVLLALFFLEGLGVKAIPGAFAFAHASLVLGLLLGGTSWLWWRAP